MGQNLTSIMQEVRALVDEYRARCLWFLREDYYPSTPAEACGVLESIERHGDVVAFRKAAVLRQWLLLMFHDTTAAVAASWIADRKVLETNRYRIEVQREREGFVEAMVTRDGGTTLLQWAADSAFRFFPLVQHVDFGLTLHPFDLATNKVLALVGRLEVRDWVDVIHCHDRIQRLGFLAWAASGKDPGFSPASILDQAGRSARYSAPEIASLAFAGAPPDASTLSRQWQAMLQEAREIVAILPPAEAGKCVLDRKGDLFVGDTADIRTAMASGSLRFHEGRIRGALPQLGR